MGTYPTVPTRPALPGAYDAEVEYEALDTTPTMLEAVTKEAVSAVVILAEADTHDALATVTWVVCVNGA